MSEEKLHSRPALLPPPGISYLPLEILFLFVDQFSRGNLFKSVPKMHQACIPVAASL